MSFSIADEVFEEIMLLDALASVTPKIYRLCCLRNYVLLLII